MKFPAGTAHPELPEDLKAITEQATEGIGAKAKITLTIKEALTDDQVSRLKVAYGNKPAINKSIDKAAKAVAGAAAADAPDDEAAGEG